MGVSCEDCGDRETNRMKGRLLELLKLPDDDLWLVVVWIARWRERSLWRLCGFVVVLGVAWKLWIAGKVWRRDDAAALLNSCRDVPQIVCRDVPVAAGEALKTQRICYRWKERGGKKRWRSRIIGSI